MVATMNGLSTIKPTPEQVREWLSSASKYSAAVMDSLGERQADGSDIFYQKLAELAAAWGAAQAQQATPEGFVRVPLVMTRAMEEVTQQEDWQWADLLAAAEAVTEEQYDMVQAQQTTVEEPELPTGVASIYVSASGEREFDDWRCDLPQGRTILYTAAQMHAFADAKVREAMAQQSQDAKRWQTVRDGDSCLTLRLHNSRPDQRQAVVDAAIDAAMKGQQ